VAEGDGSIMTSNVTSRPFDLPTGDGETIRGDIHLPGSEAIPDPGVPRSAVIVVHGFKGFRKWGFFPHTCRALAEDGHAVISFDFSLNGTGEDGEDFTRPEAFARNTFSREVDEILLVLDALREGGLLERVPERVGLMGHSRGGGVAILAARDAAARGSRIDALVTWAAVARFGRWSEEQKEEWRREGRIHVLNSRTGQQLPLGLGLLEDFEANRERLDVTAAAGKLALPWLIVHGADDPTVSVDHARELERAAHSARLIEVGEAGHTFEARHPFEGSNPRLDEVLEVTRSHFLMHLASEAAGA
jgi:uncharacterized protein